MLISWNSTNISPEHSSTAEAKTISRTVNVSQITSDETAEIVRMGNYKKLLPAFLAFFCTLWLPLASAQGFQCRTPNGQSGACISIYNCNPLLQMLKTQRQAATQYLRASHCGFQDTLPLVCCPSARIEPVTEAPVDTTLPTTPYGPLKPPYCGFSNASHTRVVGGIPAKLGAWPWIAVLGYKSTKDPTQTRWLCGGTLVSQRHILTAGHCVYGRDDLFKVRLGDLDLKSDLDGASPIELLIQKKILHPEYSSTNYINDIAILTLERDVVFTELIRPICLPVEDGIRYKNLDRTYPFIAGWGSVQYKGPSSSQLMELQIPVVETSVCQSAFSRFSNAIIDERTLCAGYMEGGKDACQGDSGGPMMLPQRQTYYLVGIVSYGYMCAEPGYPGIYTRVTEFLDFIVKNMVA